MSQNFFSPNSKISGGALFITLNEKDECLFFRFLKQIANNPNKLGNFDGKNPIQIKMNPDECADIVRAIRSKDKATFYHKFNEDVTSGTFSHYKIDTKKVDESGKSIYKEGFGFSIKRGDSQIKVGMSPAQSERLALYLSWALQRAFLSNHKEDVKYFEDNKKKSQESKAKEETPNNVAIPTPDGGVVEKTDSDVDF